MTRESANGKMNYVLWTPERASTKPLVEQLLRILQASVVPALGLDDETCVIEFPVNIWFNPPTFKF